MHPYLEIMGLKIPTYGLISLVGIILAGALAYFLAKRRGLDPNELINIAIFATIGVFVGAHLLYAITRTQDIILVIQNYSTYENIGEFLKDIWNYCSGMVFYGGLYGGVLAGFIVIKVRKLSVGQYGDIFAVALPLFHAFGRVGCFFAGCCYGVPWEHGVSGRVMGSGNVETITRFPVQLCEAGILLVLATVLCLLFLKKKFNGELMVVYLASYGVIRFILEFLRGDEIRGRFLALSTSQWISVLTLVGVAVYVVFKLINKKKKTSE